MTFIHQNQVKKFRLEFRKRIRYAFIIRNQLLVQRHVDFKTGIQFLALYLGHDFLEGLEILDHGLVNQNIAVC